MRRTITLCCGFGFLAAMLVLLFIPTRVSLWQYDAPPGSATCSSIVGAGWPTDDRLDREATSGVQDYDNGLEIATVQAVCDHRRTAFVALTALLAVPAAALLAIGFIPTRIWPARATTTGPENAESTPQRGAADDQL